LLVQFFSCVGVGPEARLEEIEKYHFVANQTFRSEDETYEFYNDYAKAKWFSIREGKVRRSLDTDEVIWRLLCSCEGYRDVQYFDRKDREREPRSLNQCGCCALMEVHLSTKTGIGYIKNFVDIHNHALTRLEHVYVLWSHRLPLHSEMKARLTSETTRDMGIKATTTSKYSPMLTNQYL
jgi:hypothetical protein